MSAPARSRGDIGSYSIVALIAEMRLAGWNGWADRVEALRRDYASATADVASVFHVDAMDEVRARMGAADQGHGAPLSALTGALVDLVGSNSLGKTLKPRDAK